MFNVSQISAIFECSCEPACKCSSCNERALDSQSFSVLSFLHKLFLLFLHNCLFCQIKDNMQLSLFNIYFTQVVIPQQLPLLFLARNLADIQYEDIWMNFIYTYNNFVK